MISAELPVNEVERLAALRRLLILDTPPEEGFDRLTRIAQQAFGVPIVQISLVDRDREWFKSHCGGDRCEGERAVAFCAHAILLNEPLIVTDARLDPRFHDSPLVVNDGIRFYAGAPLRSREGLNLGTFCIKDRDPREFSPGQITMLGQLAAAAMDLMEFRLTSLRAEAANRMKTEFLANMSHEIRTPMTAILGFADVLLDETLTREERVDAVQTIRRNGENLLQIINDILDLSKIEAGKLRVELVGCSPLSILSEIESVMRPRAAAKSLTLSVERSTLIPATIQTDPLRLRQVLWNLVGNAIKFTESGSVRMAARVTEGAAPMLEVDVVDTGIGMSPEQVSSIFAPFQQGDTSTTRRFGGTGLGLVISRRLAGLLGGDVVLVETRPGTGTRFRLTIPASPLTNEPGSTAGCVVEEPAPAAQDRPLPSLAGCRVLLADDSADTRRLISAFLTGDGAEIETAVDGERALELAASRQSLGRGFDVVLMDLHMPVLDGASAVQRLRAAGYTRPIIALSANTFDEEHERCVEAGFDDFAGKPVNRAALLKLVRNHWMRSREAALEVSL